jgi:hypothetical protein
MRLRRGFRTGGCWAVPSESTTAREDPLGEDPLGVRASISVPGEARRSARRGATEIVSPARSTSTRFGTARPCPTLPGAIDCNCCVLVIPSATFPLSVLALNFGVLFVKYLRDGVRSGAITTTVRVWQRPHVTVGHRYQMEGGEIEVDSIVPIGFNDITPALALECGFAGVQDLLKLARHGSGENVYLVRFHFIPRQQALAGGPAPRKTAVRKRRG